MLCHGGSSDIGITILISAALVRVLIIPTLSILITISIGIRSAVLAIPPVAVVPRPARARDPREVLRALRAHVQRAVPSDRVHRAAPRLHVRRRDVDAAHERDAPQPRTRGAARPMRGAPWCRGRRASAVRAGMLRRDRWSSQGTRVE